MGSNKNYEKMGKKLWCGGIKGIRLNPRRFCVQRLLRSNFLHFFRILRRWRNSCRNYCLRRRTRKGKEERGDVGLIVYSRSIRTMAHSNSFCSEVMADCLEFIKRNSVSVDDDTNPMLQQQ